MSMIVPPVVVVGVTDQRGAQLFQRAPNDIDVVVAAFLRVATIHHVHVPPVAAGDQMGVGVADGKDVVPAGSGGDSQGLVVEAHRCRPPAVQLNLSFSTLPTCTKRALRPKDSSCCGSALRRRCCRRSWACGGDKR